MVNHSLGRKPNVLFMPSFELKCFSLCYINIYITPSNTVIDSVRSLWEHIPCYSGEGRTMQGTPAVGEELLPQCRHSPRPVPIPAAAWGAPQSSRSCTNAASTVEHCKRSLKDVLWLSPLPPLHCQITAGATESHQHWDAESRDRAPVDFRRNVNELRSKFNKNFITFCFHKMMQLGAELS